MVDLGGFQKLLRIQIKGTKNNSLSFTGGIRSGEQISRTAKSRKYKHTKKDCDLIIGIESQNGICYITPIEETNSWCESKSLSKLEKMGYKENWDILRKLTIL